MSFKRTVKVVGAASDGQILAWSADVNSAVWESAGGGGPHTHTESDITDLAHLSASHTHTESDISDLAHTTVPPPFLIVPWHADGSAAFAMTNATQAERFAFNQPTRMIKLVPLNGHTQVRMVGVQVVTSASANTPRARLVYKTGAYSTTIGQYAELGATEVGFTLTGTGVRDTGWIDLVAGAVGDIQVGLTERGGDAAADPAFGHLQVMFR